MPPRRRLAGIAPPLGAGGQLRDDRGPPPDPARPSRPEHVLEVRTLPFTRLADVRTPEKYKSLLKAELDKVGELRVKRYYFENVTLEGGSKDGDAFVLLGTFPATLVDELQKAGTLKARCAIGAARDKQSLQYTVLHGALKEADLKKALGVVRTVVVEKVDAAAGEVVRTPGGRAPGPDAPSPGVALKAQFERLRAGYGKVAGSIGESTKRGWRDLLLQAEAALKAPQWPVAEQHLTTLATSMSAYAHGEPHRQKAKDAETARAAQPAVQELERLDKAQADVTSLAGRIEAAEKLAASAETGLQNALATAKVELETNPGPAKQLVTRWQALARQIETAELDCQRLPDKMGFGTPAPGEIEAAQGLKEARAAVEAGVRGSARSGARCSR